MIDASHPLVLGSGSPRRRELLQRLRIPLVVVPGEADESVREGEPPADYLARVVREKLRSVAARLGQVAYGGILVADTSVLIDDVILGKPADADDAVRMLSALSGRTHQVWTRFALAALSCTHTPVHEQTVRTLVTFRALTAGEIAGYAASGECMDKAGAYAVQGLGAFAVERIEGSYPNVVGLPSCEVVSALLRTGLLKGFPP